jgi:hypothetical protein
MRALLLLVALATPASAATTDDWLTGLTDRVIDDLAGGKSLVVEVHVPLCDNTIIACGNAKLGDGDNPATNLYWSTTPGFGRWFARKGSGWTRVAAETKDTGDKDVLEKHTYRRTIATPAAWRKRGAPKQYTLEVVIRAWRGSAIDRALAAYAADLSGTGTSAQLVAFVGHNRLMDVDEFTWPAPGKDVKGAIAIACDTAPYMKKQVSAATRVPLLMTSDLLFANAAPLEASVLAFARGGGYPEIRRDAATAYAGVRKRPVERVIGAFTNPADRRW